MLQIFPVPTPVPSSRRWIARALVPAAAALLVACGGGGGDATTPTDQVSGPPTTAATLAGASTDASASARTAVASADAAAARARSLSGVSALFGQPVGSAPVQVAGLTRRAQIQAVTTSPCTDFFDAPCSGSIVVDTNVPDNATSVGLNDFADIRFQSASGLLLGSQVSLSGRMRLDFLSTLNLNSASFTGLNVLLTLDGFSGTVNGSPFGPLSDVGRLQIDANGTSTITAGGVRYQGLSGFTTAAPTATASAAARFAPGTGLTRTATWT